MIQIENRDWRFILESYATPNALIYADPPYDVEKRSSGSDYQHDFKEKDHIELHERLLQVNCQVAVSGYDSDFMKELYKDFFYIPGPDRKNNRSKRKVKECLYTNYDPAKINSSILF